MKVILLEDVKGKGKKNDIFELLRSNRTVTLFKARRLLL